MGKETPLVDQEKAYAEKLVEDWAREHLSNTGFSANTEAWNAFVSAKAVLVERISTALKGV